MSIAIAPSVLDSSLYIPELRTRKKDSVIGEMVQRTLPSGAVREPELLVELLLLRERLGCTALGKGVAIPHARSLTVTEQRLVVARSRRGVEWGAADGQPVSLVLLALSPAELSEEAHHRLLARAVAASRLQRNRTKLMEAGSFEAVAAVLREAGA